MWFILQVGFPDPSQVEPTIRSPSQKDAILLGDCGLWLLRDNRKHDWDIEHCSAVFVPVRSTYNAVNAEVLVRMG